MPQSLSERFHADLPMIKAWLLYAIGIFTPLIIVTLNDLTDGQPFNMTLFKATMFTCIADFLRRFSTNYSSPKI